MDPGRNGHRRRRRRGAADADGFVVAGFAAVFTAVSFLLTVIVVGMGDNDAGGNGAVLSPGTQWQVILVFAAMSAGLLLIMHWMRLRDPRPPIFVRRAVDAAVLWNAGGPERLLPVPVLIILMFPVLEAWFDFF
ncbi:hypothetical protein BAE44_0015271 [Dichanthelium oligosanthes]|uniref:Uncharacterized protein n=1 Tax=Dichanthelium oligosanthes TaxID=888268 RepID=A0A1E5VF20_9POAL|nr:hypothetical protein BAE44_0015271 [Dichanthelium oligosanthes]